MHLSANRKSLSAIVVTVTAVQVHWQTLMPRKG